MSQTSRAIYHWRQHALHTRIRECVRKISVGSLAPADRTPRCRCLTVASGGHTVRADQTDRLCSLIDITLWAAMVRRPRAFARKIWIASSQR